MTRDATGTRVGAGVGGTCVNVGCVPKKLMFMAAQQRESMVGGVSTAAGYGYTVPEAAGQVDWPGLVARRDAYVQRLNRNYLAGWQKAGVAVVLGYATLVDGHTVSVKLAAPEAAAGAAEAAAASAAGEPGTDKTITAGKILVACGGAPAMPDIPGIDRAISSDGFFDLQAQPKKCAVIGAGYIAVEMAGILHGLGTDTHLFFRGDTVLRRGFDPFIVETLMGELEAHGPELHKLSTPAELRAEEGGTTAVVTTGGAVTGGFDCVLSAIGRAPVTGPLGLDKAGVKTDARGFIEVDEFENTSAADIYAIGDATTTGYELTPVAIAAGRRLADRLFGGEPRARIAYETIATVVFSHPPIGTIGLTEPAAREKYGDAAVKVKQARFGSMLYAFNDDGGKVKTGLKLVLAGPTERVVGLHCIGPFSDEMLQGFAVAVRMGATRADFEASVAIHPTVAEEFVTFGGWGQEKDPATGAARPQLPPYISAAAGGGGGEEEAKGGAGDKASAAL